MNKFAVEMRHTTQNAKHIVDKRGYCLGETPPGKGLLPGAIKDLQQVLREQAHLIKDYYSMPIEPRHQGKPELFDPLRHSPNADYWPHDEMLKSLKGQAKAVANWANEQGFELSIADVHLYDPTRRKVVREYHLVISWSKIKVTEAAA